MISAAPTLNADQLRAVDHPGGHLLVLAGPGTGKTGVLVERISHLVAGQGVSPERILALTFSRRAADEMRARVTAGLPQAEKVEVRTFHSFALSIVRRHAGSLGLRSAPEIVPTNEQWALVSDILGDEDPASWGLPPGAFGRPATVREVYDLMLRAQEYLLTPRRLRDLGERTDRPYLVRAGAVLERYGDRLKQAAKADYEGVVQYALRLLRPGGRAAAEISSLYDHVLVDEFQDTNGSQMELLRRLMLGERPNVFCVGDDAQSIYGFRGARIENVRNFAEVFPGTREIHLRTNYRSAAHIVSLAEQAISGDESRPARDPQAVASIANLGTVLHKVASSPREEGEWIADRIVELTQGQGVPREEIAILRRSLLDAAPLVDALASRGIPVDMAVSPGGSSARHLATLLAATGENADDPNPTPAAIALVSPLCGVSPEAARALRVAAEAGGRSVFGLLRSGDSVAGVPEQELEKARNVVRTVDAAASQGSFAEKVDALWKGLPATRGLFERHAEEQDAALALTDALSFVRSAHAYARMSHSPTVDGFLRAGKMLHEDSDTWAPSAPPAEGAVRLLTVHASKGLEFEAVFVGGLVDERFPIRPRGVRFVDPGLLSDGSPTPRAQLDQSHLFEERRLFYVALTRAKIYLFLTGVEESGEDGLKASTFLRELEDRLVELAETARPRRFWISREEAVEELRRAACDRDLPEPSRFAAARALARMGEHPETWWRYLGWTAGTPAPPELRDLRARDLLLHLDCPRRAFMERISTVTARRGGTGRMIFGSVFSDGLRRFLEGEEETLTDAMLATVEVRDFGGPAFKEYWRRQALDAVASCEEWAHETRERLVTTDVLSEGQNLQDADSVVNYDLHWNPTKMVQRTGRIDRLGSPHKEITVHNFFPDEGLDELLGLIERLATKIEAIDRNVGLESTILGEKVNPKDFNALKRIEEEDQSVTAELEEETEVSGEVLRQILADYLKEFGTAKLERIPYGVHSGFASGRPSFFFHFRVRGKHVWRLYDEESGEILESHLGIYKRIRCGRDTPRLDSGRDVHTVLAEVKESLLVDLNARIGVSAAPTQLFKEQRDALAILRSNLKHPTVAREDSVELTKIVRRPLARTLRRELRDILNAHEANGDYDGLVTELQSFVGRYGLRGDAPDGPTTNGSGETEITEEELELVAYLDLS